MISQCGFADSPKISDNSLITREKVAKKLEAEEEEIQSIRNLISYFV
jgi:hypothetical protein